MHVNILQCSPLKVNTFNLNNQLYSERYAVVPIETLFIKLNG